MNRSLSHNRKETEMFYWLRVMLTPSCWIQIHHYSSAWDRKLNSLMDSEKFVEIERYNATIGGYTLWIANHPYASFTFRDVRPSRATILRAHDKLMMDAFESEPH